MLFTRTNLLGRVGDEHVQASSALKCRPVCDIKETAAIPGSIFTVPFGDIQRDRSGRPVQLLFDLTDSHGAVHESPKPRRECDRFAVDLQAFMIEPAFRRIVHSILLLILIVLLILFLIIIFLFILLFLLFSGARRDYRRAARSCPSIEDWRIIRV